MRDPAMSENGRSRLEEKLADKSTFLRAVPLALDFGIKLDLDEIEQRIEEDIAINGEPTADSMLARYNIAFKKGSPKKVAEYLSP
eukprot:UN14654